MKLSPVMRKLAKALDDNKETGDAGDVRAMKISPKTLSKLTGAQLKKLVVTAAAAPGYVDDKGRLPSDQRYTVKAVPAKQAYVVLREAFEQRDVEENAGTPERKQLEATIRSVLPPLLAGKGVKIFEVNLPDDGYGAIAGVAVVDQKKGEIRIVENTVIP
jgi:hypothetical protein